MVKSKIRKCYRVCKNQYLVFGDEIENFAKQNVKKIAKVQAETLRVRKNASTESKIIALASKMIN